MRAHSMTIAAGLLAVTGLAALAGCSGESAADDGVISAGSATKGAPIFRRVCAQCHGPAGKGMPNLGKDMTHSTYISESSDDALLDFIIKGRLPTDELSDGNAAMPPRGGDPTLSDQQIMHVIAFIRKIQQ